MYQALLDEYVKKGVPGLVVLIKTPNEGLWIGTSGYSGIEVKTPMQKCNIVYSASIGKTFFAVAIMKLAEEGKLNLDDKINQYLHVDICDKIPSGNTATIRNLLGQRAGISNWNSRGVVSQCAADK
ncbi:MAG: serine hydrolase [Chitinophagaceae bacterium]